MSAIQKCETCQKTFVRKGDLARHEQIHTGLRPHICLYCGKGFSQRCGLNTHINIHTQRKPYKCGINTCPAVFGDPSSCHRHRKEIHNPVEYHYCPVNTCSSRIKRRSAFLKHLRELHGMSPDEIYKIVGVPKRGPVMRRFSKSVKGSVNNKQPSSQIPVTPILKFQKAVKQPANPANALNSQSCSEFSLFDWQQQLLQESTQFSPQSSALFEGTDFMQPFVAPQYSFGQLYHLNTPCSPLSMQPDTPPYSEALFDPSYYFTPTYPKYRSQSTIAPSVDSLSPLTQFTSLPHLPFEASTGYEADTNLFDDDYSTMKLEAFFRESPTTSVV